MLGTAGYLAPEQALGERTSPASDRYALGVVAFELLTGARPFARESPTAEAAAHVSEPVPSVARRSGLPHGLDAVFARALAKRPEDRYGTCAEFVAALRAALATRRPGQRACSAPTAPLPPARPARARQPRWPLLLGCAARRAGSSAAVVASLGASRVDSREAAGNDDAPTQANDAPRRRPATAAVPTTAPRPAASVARTQLNDQAWALMQQGQLLRRAAAARSAPCPRCAAPGRPIPSRATRTTTSASRCYSSAAAPEARRTSQRAQALEPQRTEVRQRARRVDQCLAPQPGSRGKRKASKHGDRSPTRLAPMRILVTGAAGFIGSNFVRYWRERRPRDHVVAYDLLTYAGVRENVPDDVPFVEGDIADLDLAERTLAEHEIDVVVNFAAESHNSLAVLDPGLFARTNVVGTQAARGGPRRRRRALPPRLDVRGVRRPAARLRATVPTRTRRTVRGRRTTRRRRGGADH